MPESLTKSAYHALLNEISGIYTRSRAQADAALNKLRNAAYWEIGRHLVKVEQANSLRAEYGRELIQNISNDLTAKYGSGFSVTNLQNMRQFYLAFPSIHQTSVELAWSAYQVLSTVKDKTVRLALTKKAAKSHWSVRELKAAIREQKIEITKEEPALLPAPEPAVPKLKAAPGVVHTYRLEFIPADLLGLPGPAKGGGEYCVDLGFSVSTAMESLGQRAVGRNPAQGPNRPQRGTKGLKKVTAGMLVELTASGLKESAAKPADLYTYHARLDRIVDGDTLKCFIELGFGLYISQKLRLRGIDCQELSTAKGQAVKAFVEATLKGKPLVIKTHKTDKWDRYLVDVWYDGDQYLNQILLDKGLAEIYQE